MTFIDTNLTESVFIDLPDIIRLYGYLNAYMSTDPVCQSGPVGVGRWS